MQVTLFAHMVVFHRTENNITSTMEITVCPDDPVEIRRLHLHSTNKQPYRLRLTSYGEVILTQQATDRRHPAFNKLFIENEFVPELNLQIFTRRPRSNEEKPVFMAMLVVNPKRHFMIAGRSIMKQTESVYRSGELSTSSIIQLYQLVPQVLRLIDLCTWPGSP
jgi:cyclic beta-1,2-glucan synthetase